MTYFSNNSLVFFEVECCPNLDIPNRPKLLEYAEGMVVIMKKLNKLFVCMAFLISMLISAQPVFANTNSNESLKAIFVSVYDDIHNEYCLENTKLSIGNGYSIINSIEKLKENKIIKDLSVTQNDISSITFNNDNKLEAMSNPYEAKFYVKVNGFFISEENVTDAVKSGDIVEWIYINPNKVDIQSSAITKSEQLNTNMRTNIWDSNMAKVLNDAYNWVNRNAKSSNFYLIAVGVAGKTADVKTVNTFVNDIKKAQEYNTATDISRRILSATFCGFDASSTEYGQLLTKLYTYKDIMKQGIFGAVNALTAYDSNKYTVKETTLNSRKKLIDIILSYQLDDGGFGLTKESKSDIDTTAMTITALSNYKNQEDVKKAIVRSIEFLLKSQTKDGGFGYMGQECSESLATVIIALKSLGYSVNDKRFMHGKENLLDSLLKYKNSDGGFSHIKGDKSSAIPTEQAMIALASIKKGGNPYIVTNLVEQHIAETPIVNTKDIKHDVDIISISAVILASIGLITIIITRIRVKVKLEDKSIR